MNYIMIYNYLESYIDGLKIKNEKNIKNIKLLIIYEKDIFVKYWNKYDNFSILGDFRYSQNIILKTIEYWGNINFLFI